MKIHLVLAAVAGLAGSCLGPARAGAQGFPVTDAQIDRLGIELETPVPVEVLTVATGPAQIVVPPAHQAIASAPVAGLLSRLLVAPGGPVAAGDLIAELESAELLEWQRVFLDSSIELELASLELARARALVADGIVAERRLEESRARHRAASARVAQWRQQLVIAGLDDKAIARLAESGTLTSRLGIRAPIDGVVTARFAEPGARVAALDPVARVADLSTVWAEVHLSAERAVAVTTGMQLLLPHAAGDLLAPITVVGQVIDNATQTVLVRAELDNADSRLRAGQYLSARIVTESAARSGFSLPVSALVRQGEDPYVFIRRAGHFVPLRVSPLHEDERQVLLADGLEPGMRVATRGASTLKSLWLASLDGAVE